MFTTSKSGGKNRIPGIQLMVHQEEAAMLDATNLWLLVRVCLTFAPSPRRPHDNSD